MSNQKVNIIRKICKKIANIYNNAVMIIKIVLKSIFYKKKVYLCGIPVHGNLGDHAILLAEEKFLQNNFPNVKYIEVKSSIIVKYKKILQKLIGKSTILISGGGFLGSLWLNEELMFRTILQTFKQNKIIVFPQTVYFSNEKEEEHILEESKKIYSSHKNLTICCREQYSYEFMQKNFPECKVMLVPDMVLYLDSIQAQRSRDGVLFCIRKDKEKVQYDFEKIKKHIIKMGITKIDYTDTVINKYIYSHKNRKKEVKAKINQFSNYKLVITDRLHGMVFALLSNTPCLVFENKSYKVKGVYKWIENVKFIKLCSSNEQLENEIQQLLNNTPENYSNENLKKQYENLVEQIKNSITK